jgi:hypothetical protein
MSENYDFSKYKEDEVKEILNNFSKHINDLNLMQKLTIFGYYDWYHLSSALFEDNDLAFFEIQKLFHLSEKEKKEFEKLKESHFSILYEKYLEDLKLDINKANFSVISEFNFIETTEDTFDSKFKSNFKKILIELNLAN